LQLLSQFLPPLLGQRRRTENCKTANLPSVYYFPGNQGSLYGFTDPHIVCDKDAQRIKAQGHQQGDELVRSGLHGDSGETAKRSCGRTRTETHRFPQQPAGAMITQLIRVRKTEASRLDRFQAGQNGGAFHIRST